MFVHNVAVSDTSEGKTRIYYTPEISLGHLRSKYITPDNASGSGDYYPHNVYSDVVADDSPHQSS